MDGGIDGFFCRDYQAVRVPLKARSVVKVIEFIKLVFRCKLREFGVNLLRRAFRPALRLTSTWKMFVF